MSEERSPILDLISETGRTAKGFEFPEVDVERVIDLNGGSPDPHLFPGEDFLRLMEGVLREDRFDSMGYGGGGSPDMTYGYGGLRDELVEWVARDDGREIDPTCIMLTSGAAQALDVVFHAFVSAGDTVVVEEPTWDFVLQPNALYGATPVAVPTDIEGIRIEELEEQLERSRAEGAPVKLLYTIANFNTPTGVCMSLERRKRLVALAAKWNFVILEDDTYGEIRYEGEPIPSLFGLDEAGLVVKVKTFSKFLAPAMRTGWIQAHPGAIAAMTLMRRDLGNSQLISRVLARWLREGNLEPHLKETVPRYAAKRDLMEAGLREHCAPHVSWNHPDGGFNIWLQLSGAVDVDQLNAAMAAMGVQGRAGHNFYLDQTVRPSMRAAFSRAPEADIERAMVLLGRAIDQSLV